MLKHCLLCIAIVCFNIINAQSYLKEKTTVEQDSTKKAVFLKHLGNGYLPTKYFNFDLRYLIKFNQYEGIRTGIGGVTNKAFSENFRINAYSVYGFNDHRFKYSIGSGFKIAPKTNTWLNISYTDDVQETGSTKFLTDGRFFQFFEPRLLNIDLFHKHITKAVNLEHQLFNKLTSEVEFSVSKIEPTYSYSYNLNNTSLTNFRLTMAKASFQWSPFSSFNSENDYTETVVGYPKFSLQYSKSLRNAFNSDFSFSKIDFRALHRLFVTDNDSFSEITLVAGLANGNVPITHMYHAYPNNITKQTIMQRFSVAGLNSFETMYFNEFFSDKFTTFQFKHFLKPFDVYKRNNPQLVLITRFALGDMEQPEKHENINFNTLDKGYLESGFEINKLLFGFGLSFTYRYGAYHLPSFTDNVAFKFTFNITM